MKTLSKIRPGSQAVHGFAIVLVMMVSGFSLLVLSATLNWTYSQSTQVQRATQESGIGSAAEAGSEMVVSRIIRDFLANGENYVYTNLSVYAQIYPTNNTTNGMTGYLFSNSLGTTNRSYVARTNSWAFGDVSTKYTGLKGYSATYQVISQAKLGGETNAQSGAVKQEVQLVEIPLCQFEYFYATNMEVTPSETWPVEGRVHANGNIYVEPNNVTLTFSNHVTASGKIYHSAATNDPVTTRTLGTIKYLAERDEGARTLNLPFVVSNLTTSWSAILDVPPSGEDPSSLLGRERFYNKADMIVRFTSNSVLVTSGRYNNFSNNVPTATYNTLLTATNSIFYNMREQRTVRVIDLNINRFNNNGFTNSLNTLFGRPVRTVYVSDERLPGTNNYQPGVRLINAQNLPTGGLTIATPNPLYLKSHFNAPTTATTNTSATQPALLVADSITIQSSSWNDTEGENNMNASSRNASAVTVNVAIITGIVSTGNGYYSGGVDNVLRLMEDWGSKTLTFNGSIAVLFESRVANAPWGASDQVYRTPNHRAFSWDSNFSTLSKLPKNVPYLRTVIRKNWASLAGSQ